MHICDLKDLRQDMEDQAELMRREAQRVAQQSPAEAETLRRIADRLTVYSRDFLRD